MKSDAQVKFALVPGKPSGKRDNPPLLVDLNRFSSVPMFLQIYGVVRHAILSGRIAAGRRLPSSRALAEDLGVSRTTIVLAYEQLESEGYVVGRGSAGTVVADLPLIRKNNAPDMPLATTAASGAQEVPYRAAPAPFRLGEPAIDLFPIQLWTRLYATCARRLGKSLLGYGDPAGYLPLRQAIAEYVSVSRSVRASAGEVILVRGAQQAMDLVARVLLRPGNRVWVEDPGYLAVRTLIQFADSIPVPVPVDKHGLVVEAGARLGPVHMVCVAPSHHFPLGHTLSLARRLALLNLAKQKNFWIFEDDFDSEFRYRGSPIASLQGLDDSGRVIYAGTFSKTLYPSLRLGYLISPPDLVEKFRAAKEITDYLSPSVEQATLAAFIQEGHFTRHVRNMRSVYRERQSAITAAAAKELPDLLRVEHADTGMHVIAWLVQKGADDSAISRAAMKQGIEAKPLSRYCLKAKLPPALVLGFAALPPAELLSGMRSLRKVITSIA